MFGYNPCTPGAWAEVPTCQKQPSSANAQVGIPPTPSAVPSDPLPLLSPPPRRALSPHRPMKRTMAAIPATFQSWPNIRMLRS